jgi:hypothetical protein
VRETTFYLENNQFRVLNAPSQCPFFLSGKDVLERRYRGLSNKGEIMTGSGLFWIIRRGRRFSRVFSAFDLCFYIKNLRGLY